MAGSGHNGSGGSRLEKLLQLLEGVKLCQKAEHLEMLIGSLIVWDSFPITGCVAFFLSCVVSVAACNTCLP